MKAKSNTRGASKKQPITGAGDKGIQSFMKGKPDAKAAYMKLGTDKKFANKFNKK
jgi:hypothetical protein